MARISSQTVLLGTAMLVAAGAFALGSLPQTAQAAVTVISGSGPAQMCYDGADNGGDPREYVPFCDEALHSVLSAHDRAATYINRGVLMFAALKADEAASDFDAGLAIDGNIPEGYVDRGAALIMKKDYSDAIKDIDKGISLGAKDQHLAYYDRGMADEGLGDVQGAYHDYRQALAVQPSFTLASDQLKRFHVVRKTDGT
jgi:tetratricopeptide (TPR) repeat protein